jgi:hypothetical protein
MSAQHENSSTYDERWGVSRVRDMTLNIVSDLLEEDLPQLEDG